MQYAKRQSQFRLDGNPGSWHVPASNPNNPTGGPGTFYVRPTTTIGARVSDHESNTIRMAVGLRGDIISDGFLNEWSWELSHLYTRVDADLMTDAVWNLARANIISDPDRCALDPICSAAVNPSGALDVMRPGNWTADEIRYLKQVSVALSEFQTSGWFGVVTGPLFDVPAGQVEAAFGFETRTDRGFAKPDPVTEAGESIANQVTTTKGRFKVTEFFGEVTVPLLADLMLVDFAELNLQARSSDYSNFGEESVWRVGLNWQVAQDVRLRANRSTAYRAPTVTDLFTGAVESFDFFDHPCAAGDPARQPGNNVDQNCLMDGIPGGLSQVAAQFSVTAGGNPNLLPETADTSTVGVVLTPRFLPGFSMTVDLWKVKVLGLITRITSDSIVDSCYEGPVGLTAPECDLFDTVVTLAGIEVVDLVNQNINSSQVTAKGGDLGLRYEFDGPFDTFVTADLNGTYNRRNTFYPGAGNADDRGSMPRIRASGFVRVDKNDWDFTWRLRYTDGMDDPRFDGNNAFGYDTVPSHTEHDLRVGWNPGAYRVLLGVNDLFDKDPPYVFSSGTNTDLFLYGAVGRYVFLRVNFYQ